MWSPARTRTVSASECSMTLRLRSTASAVPRYHSATRPREMYGWRSFTPPWFRSRSHGRPSPMWSLSDRGLYWVRTNTSSMCELTQFDRGKSMIRYLPPNGTAGLARTEDRIESRSPSPPARISAMVRFNRSPPQGSARSYTATSPGSSSSSLTSAPVRASPEGAQPRGDGRRRPPSGKGLEEDPRVDPRVVELGRPVEVRPLAPAGAALVGDELALGDVLADVD